MPASCLPVRSRRPGRPATRARDRVAAVTVRTKAHPECRERGQPLRPRQCPFWRMPVAGRPARAGKSAGSSFVALREVVGSDSSYYARCPPGLGRQAGEPRLSPGKRAITLLRTRPDPARLSNMLRPLLHERGHHRPLPAQPVPQLPQQAQHRTAESPVGPPFELERLQWDIGLQRFPLPP